MQASSVSYLWREPKAAEGFARGVSLHSHTNQSQETLDFIAELGRDSSIFALLMRWAERRSFACTGIQPDYARSFWTPPLTPRLAFELEQGQIEEKLHLPALVSLTDHDDIQAPMLLRTVASSRHIPVSLEWTVPFGPTAFHLGVHNLPSADGTGWHRRMGEFTTFASAAIRVGGLDAIVLQAKMLHALLAELDELSGVLIVFNHPLWDLYRIGAERHTVAVNEFLAVHGQYLHALELNGLRTWAENADVRSLAARWNQLIISGGDRHGIEPNANVNLTMADSFTGFVHEVRRERRSHVLFLPQYRQPWKHRILESTLAAVRNYPEFPEGSRRWDERVYHPDRHGILRPVSELWVDGRVPAAVRAAIATLRLLGARPVSSSLKFAWNDAGEMRAALAELDR